MGYTLRAYSEDLTLGEALQDGNSYFIKGDINYIYELTESVEIAKNIETAYGYSKVFMLLNEDKSRALVIPSNRDISQTILSDYFEEKSEATTTTYIYEVQYLNVGFNFFKGEIVADSDDEAQRFAYKEVLTQLEYVNENMVDIEIDLDIDHIKITANY